LGEFEILCLIIIFCGAVLVTILLIHASEFRPKKNKIIETIIIPGDFIIVDWFLRDQIAIVRQGELNSESYFVRVLPLTVSGERFIKDSCHINPLALLEYSYWLKKEDVKRMANRQEIDKIKQEYTII
jgi:hypothetical protein